MVLQLVGGSKGGKGKGSGEAKGKDKENANASGRKRKSPSNENAAIGEGEDGEFVPGSRTKKAKTAGGSGKKKALKDRSNSPLIDEDDYDNDYEDEEVAMQVRPFALLLLRLYHLPPSL